VTVDTTLAVETTTGEAELGQLEVDELGEVQQESPEEATQAAQNATPAAAVPPPSDYHMGITVRKLMRARE
jgi:hypothetical protein